MYYARQRFAHTNSQQGFFFWRFWVFFFLGMRVQASFTLFAPSDVAFQQSRHKPPKRRGHVASLKTNYILGFEKTKFKERSRRYHLAQKKISSARSFTRN